MRTMSSERLRGLYDPTIRELKRDVFKRISKARSEGVSAAEIADASGAEISIHIVYDMLNAEIFGREVWEQVDSGLKKIGY